MLTVVFLSLLIVVGFIAIGSIVALPAWALWRIKKDWRYPGGWFLVVSAFFAFAAMSTIGNYRSLPKPTPIHKTLSDISDHAGELRVLSIRLPNPEMAQARIEIDVENRGTEPRFVGMQYHADGGSWRGFSPGASSGAAVLTAPAKWNGTLTFPARLPGFTQGGYIVIVLALCPEPIDSQSIELPLNSEALYQERFELTPPFSSEAGLG
ncbi:MAG: hypothetical protein AMXMBFR4_20490 [Candidatus Hydrogenedentota bacterium]